MNVIIAGGGTGGHLFPGVALAEELRGRGHDVTFVGTHKGIEARVVPELGWPLELIDVAGMKGTGVMGALRGAAMIPRAMAQAGAILRRVQPALVVGVGGYASGPMVMRAVLARVPTAILEQNSVPGITNKALGRIVRLVCGAFPGARRYFPARKYRLLGNPVRAKVRAAMQSSTQRTPRTLLVVGGSQGAHAVNELVAGALEVLRARNVVLPVVHQTGDKDREPLAARYAAMGLDVDTRAFIDDMAVAYREARLVIGRAGATTLAELTALGVPSLLIPFPQAADDHQTANARDLVEAGAAEMAVQADSTPSTLAERIEALWSDEPKLERMRSAAKTMGRPDAHRDIADALLALV